MSGKILRSVRQKLIIISGISLYRSSLYRGSVPYILLQLLPGHSIFNYRYTVEPRLSGPRLSGLFDYPDFFSDPVFFMNINKL